MTKETNEYLDQLLTHKKGYARAMGRFNATEIEGLVKDWLRAEMARKTRPEDITIALASVFGMLMATWISVSLDDEDKQEALQKSMEEIVQKAMTFGVPRISDLLTANREATNVTTH